MRGMRGLTFGSSFGISTVGHINESVLIEVDGSSYLFGVGERSAGTMRSRTVLDFCVVSDRFQADTPNFHIYSIRSIFLLHFDADHVGGLSMLLQVMRLWRRRHQDFGFKPENKLALYLPEEAVKPFRDFIEVLHLSKLRCELEILPVEEGGFYVDEMARVSAFKNAHIEDGHSSSFLATAEGKRVVCSSDLRS